MSDAAGQIRLGIIFNLISSFVSIFSIFYDTASMQKSIFVYYECDLLHAIFLMLSIQMKDAEDE